MAQNTLNDRSSGDVVIRSGPPASSGGSGGGGSFGGNRVGASGVFGGVSQKTIKARKRVKQEYLAAEARKRAQAAADAAKAQEQARVLARQQLLASWTPRYNSFRAVVDQHFAGRSAQLALSLEQEISAARRPPVHDSSERWQLPFADIPVLRCAPHGLGRRHRDWANGHDGLVESSQPGKGCRHPGAGR